jgi:plasmid stabilization system protein ParE
VRYRIRWLKGAISDLRQHRLWLESLPRAKPRETIAIIRGTAFTLARHGDIGSFEEKSGQRSIAVPERPYRLVCRMVGDTIDIIAVFHTAQNR